MPVNNKLKKKEFPMEIKFGKLPHTEFVNNLRSIKVQLTQAPKYKDIKKSSIAFANATWVDTPWDDKKIKENMSKEVQDKFMYNIFANKILPTTMEGIKLTFLIDGITLQEVTHILRYRRAVFSAECSGDKFLHDKEFCVPTAVENSNDFYKRYKNICLEAKQLYCDMVDSKEINIHDARYIMPRALETFYYMNISLKDALLFIYDRVDKQIQPQSDNIIAYYMMIELVKQYPILSKILNKKFIHRKADFYIKTAEQFRSTNWYCPDEDSDCFEYNEESYVYGDRTRDSLLGLLDRTRLEYDIFAMILKEVEEILDSAESQIDLKYGVDFFDKDLTKEEIGWCY